MKSAEPLVNTYPQYPFEIASGSGVMVTDTTGQEYLDLYGGHAVCGIGHCHPHLTAALAQQAEKLLFYSNLTALAIRTQAAEKLLAFADSHLASVFFCNSGAEANENALKLAIQLTGRSEIISLTGGFHGRTTLAAAVTDSKKWHDRMPGWTGNVQWIGPNKADELSTISESTAAVIVEPIQSIGGVTVLDREYLASLEKRCKEVGALLIFDEIQTGMGRTGVPFVNGHWGANADISTSAKSLAGGVPVGAMLVTEEISKEISIGDLGSTFGGSPLASAAVLAVLEVMENEDLVAHAHTFGESTKKLAVDCDLVTEVRGAGCLLGLQLTAEAKEVVTALRDNHQILAGISGVSDVMRLLPPLNTPLSTLDTLSTALQKIGEELK